MKKILIIVIAVLCNAVAFAGADVHLIITNNSKQNLKYINCGGDWNGIVVGDIPLGIRQDINMGQTIHITTRCNWGCGADGWVNYVSEDNKGKMGLTYDNPSIGSSEYSTLVAEGNYKMVITGINSDVNPQLVYIEITGGDETPPKPRYSLTTTGKNTINGSITWNESTQGNPISNDWNSIFKFVCTVPTIFQVADNGKDYYNGERGNFMGSVQSGTLILGALETLPNNIKKLNFSFVNVAENLQINKFDVTIKVGDLWVAPASLPKPSPTYQFYAGTTLNETVRFVSPSLCTANFGIVAGWGDPTPGATNTGDISTALNQRKRNSVLPSNAFMQIAATKSMSNIKSQDVNSIKQNVNKSMIKNAIRIRQ